MPDTLPPAVATRPLFLDDDERAALRRPDDPVVADCLWALRRRAEARAARPGLLGPGDAVDWWRPVAEYLSDAALAHALAPSEPLAAWLRDVTLALARRPVADWVGPAYRNHGGDDDAATAVGHLETAHLCWGLAFALDLAPEVFTAAERDELGAVLAERGIPLCLRWLSRPQTIANWRLVLLAGAAVPAAVLDQRAVLERVVDELAVALDAFQHDGSYAESLQYGSYAASAAMLCHEALRRRDPELAVAVPVARYAGYARWAAASHLYRKPLPGWDGERPRALNFNDSGAMFRPAGDLLMHLAARARDCDPQAAGLARWLFDQCYGHDPAQGPHDQASFGLVNHFGALSLVLAAKAAPPLSPAAAGLDPLQVFDCGDTIARDAWDGHTVLGFHGGGAPLHGPGHLHEDLGSLILVHRRERLLVDPGHSCYRNAIRPLDVATGSHSTCTFSLDADGLAGLPMEERIRPGTIVQHGQGLRRRPGQDPVDRGARRLIAQRSGALQVVGSEQGACYGAPIERFERLCLLCGAHVLFVVDRVRAALPVTTRWHWLLNDRDGALDWRQAGRDRLVARRGDAGMKLFHLAGGSPLPPTFAQVHDAYHCLPAHPGEGRPGSGMLVGWQAAAPATRQHAVHAVAMDRYGAVAGWHLRADDDAVVIAGPDETPRWRLAVDADAALIELAETTTGAAWRLAEEDGRWSLTTL